MLVLDKGRRIRRERLREVGLAVVDTQRTVLNTQPLGIIDCDCERKVAHRTGG